MTTSARSAILRDIRANLNRTPKPSASAKAPDTAPETAPDQSDARGIPSVIPSLAQGSRPELIRRFLAAAEAAAASTERVAPGDEGQAVAAFLRHHSLPLTVAVATDPRLDGVAAEPSLTVHRRGRDQGAPVNSDAVGVSLALAGLAETGSLLLASGVDSPATLNMLPDTHIIVIHASDVVGGLENAWQRLRDAAAALAPKPQTDPPLLPRTVHLITGPSRTGDIEQTLQLGAHGPRRLHIVLVDDDPTSRDC